MNRDTQPAAIVDGSRQAADRVSDRLARDAAERRSERDLALAREQQVDLRAAEALLHARLHGPEDVDGVDRPCWGEFVESRLTGEEQHRRGNSV